MGWFKDFITGVFGGFWASLTTWAIKILIGPAVFFIFGPLLELSAHVAERLLAKIEPHLGDVGLQVTGIGAWLVDKLRVQDCLSMMLTFLILGFTVSLFKKVIS